MWQLYQEAYTHAANVRTRDLPRPRPWRGFLLIFRVVPMKENVLDVLMYLFQNPGAECDADAEADRETVETELLEAGFDMREVDQALNWLDSLVEGSLLTQPLNPSSSRIYVAAELQRMGHECLSFILRLEQIGILNPETRETVMDRVMALDVDYIDIRQLKWIILIVLFNSPDQEQACAWMESLVFDPIPNYLH